MTRREPMFLLIAALVLLALSRVGALEPGTWVLEIAPILLIAPILVVTAKRFPLTPLVYRLLFLHAIVLMVGGHYTYAKVPLGFWAQDALGLARNHYDRLGHFAQGFVPAMLAREVLLRRSPLHRGKWLAFLGTQGDVWDTQWDMFMALVGATTALLVLSRAHDRQLALVTPVAEQKREHG
jgi:putative membrane protein